MVVVVVVQQEEEEEEEEDMRVDTGEWLDEVSCMQPFLLRHFVIIPRGFGTSSTADNHLGPVTDYGSSMLQWMRHRRPRYRGGVVMEVERPSPSYIVDVRSSTEYHCHHILYLMLVLLLDASSSCKPT